MAVENRNIRKLYKIVRCLQFNKRPLSHAVVDSDGSIKSDSCEVRQVFLNHFCEILHGTRSTLPALRQQYRDEIAQIRSSLDASLNAGDNVIKDGIPKPSVEDLGSLISALKSGVAPGLDGIPNEAIKLAKSFSTSWLNHMFSFIQYHDVPFAWLGGILQEVPKKGTLTLPSNFRDVMMADCAGKVIKKYYRGIFAHSLSSTLVSTQCGGFLHRGIDFCSHWVRSHELIAKGKGWSSCMFFLDLRQAFASSQEVYG